MSANEELDYAGGGLKQETNWWGAFVIGLAGTILVTLTGYLLCLLLAELSAMMPERTGGSPSYAYPAFREKWPRAAKHINGITAWAYWLGWFPVAPLNMILASFYLADRFHLNTTSGFTPIHTFIAWSTVGISVVGILLFFIPAYLGIRFGTVFATVLGKAFGGSGASVLHRLLALMLLVGRAVSALNAIMRCPRSLHQMSVDGQFPRVFQRINKHGVPDRAMGFNVVCSLVVILAGG